MDMEAITCMPVWYSYLQLIIVDIILIHSMLAVIANSAVARNQS